MAALSWGTLPKIFSLAEVEDKIDYLNSYCDAYLREEIIAEQIVRNVTPFRHFLEVAAQGNSKIINYSNIAKSIGVDTTTVQNYFQILEDTFAGVLLQPFHESIRERQRKNPKFYFFDTGVTRSLQNRLTLPLVEQSFEFGDLFEQFIILEFIRLNFYFKKSWKFSYLMTKNNVEIDLIVERPGAQRLLVEIKSTDAIQNLPDSHWVGFRKIVKDFPNALGVCVSRDPVAFVKDGIRFVHWKQLFDELF
jgi:predicted AAA+ superfamily ATPase